MIAGGHKEGFEKFITGKAWLTGDRREPQIRRTAVLTYLAVMAQVSEEFLVTSARRFTVAFKKSFCDLWRPAVFQKAMARAVDTYGFAPGVRWVNAAARWATRSDNMPP
jgi:hypothetical protein